MSCANLNLFETDTNLFLWMKHGSIISPQNLNNSLNNGSTQAGSPPPKKAIAILPAGKVMAPFFFVGRLMVFLQ